MNFEEIIKKKSFRVASGIVITLILLICVKGKKQNGTQEVSLGAVKKRSFSVQVNSMGELDAERSTTIASSLRGDITKLIELIPDGSPVKTGDIIAKVDPTPFEEIVNDLALKIQDQKILVTAHEKSLEREMLQVDYENECAHFEVEAAHLELQKTVEGDGPLELSRLKSAMLKARSKYDQLTGYLEELEKLQSDAFSTPGEISQCRKQIEEEYENFEIAKQQYDNYVKYLFPSMVQRAELNYKKAVSREKDVQKGGEYRTSSAKVALEQVREVYHRLCRQHRAACNDLEKTSMKAPTPGIVVHRLEFRGEKKRKPILGDMLLKNQALLEIPDLSQMIVRLKIREMDLHRVQLGKEASIEVDAFPGQVFSGKVSHIGILAQPDYSGGSRDKCFELVVKLDNFDQRLRPGMTARVTIHSENYQDILSLPAHAVFTQDRKYYCYLKNRRGCQKREIDITPGNDLWAVVNGGLTEGDQVLLYLPMDN